MEDSAVPGTAGPCQPCVYFDSLCFGTRMSAPVTRRTSVIESNGRSITACAFRIASSSGPDMKQNALPSSRFTCAACPNAWNSAAARSSSSNCSKNCSSVRTCVGKLPLVLSCVSMKYFISNLLSGYIVHMHDSWQKNESRRFADLGTRRRTDHVPEIVLNVVPHAIAELFSQATLRAIPEWNSFLQSGSPLGRDLERSAASPSFSAEREKPFLLQRCEVSRECRPVHADNVGERGNRHRAFGRDRGQQSDLCGAQTDGSKRVIVDAGDRTRRHTHFVACTRI